MNFEGDERLKPERNDPSCPNIWVIAMKAVVLATVFTLAVYGAVRLCEHTMQQSSAVDTPTMDHTRFREAEIQSLANLMMASNPTLYRRLAVRYSQILNESCMMEGVGDVTLLACMMIRESRCRYDARSKAGAQGLMQVMPFWTKEFQKWKLPYNEPSDIYDPEVNIRAGVAIFARCLKAAKNDLFKALCYYNAGYRDNGSAGVPYARSILAMYAKAGE